MKATRRLHDLGSVSPVDGGDAGAVLAEFAKAGVDANELANRLQGDGTASCVASWTHLVEPPTERGIAAAAR